jgi:hypothetical protein
MGVRGRERMVAGYDLPILLRMHEDLYRAMRAGRAGGATGSSGPSGGRRSRCLQPSDVPRPNR